MNLDVLGSLAKPPTREPRVGGEGSPGFPRDALPALARLKPVPSADTGAAACSPSPGAQDEARSAPPRPPPPGSTRGSLQMAWKPALLIVPASRKPVPPARFPCPGRHQSLRGPGCRPHPRGSPSAGGGSRWAQGGSPGGTPAGVGAGRRPRTRERATTDRYFQLKVLMTGGHSDGRKVEGGDRDSGETLGGHLRSLPLVLRDIPLLHRENIYPLIPETKLSATVCQAGSLFPPRASARAVALPLALPCLVTPHLRPG